MRRENYNSWIAGIGLQIAILVLSACQTDYSALSSRKAATVIIAPDAPKKPVPLNATPRETEDLVGNLIVKVETQTTSNHNTCLYV